MTYTLNSSQVAYLTSVRNNGPDPDGTYNTLYTTILQLVVDDYGLSTESPKAGVENSVWLWLNGARDVNSGIGYFSDFIRTYTEKQFLLRTGEPLASGAVQTASNEIALSVADQIINDNGLIPDILTIAEKDAGAIASGIFGGNYSGWAGTLLFPFLGANQFTQDWLLTLNTSSQKPLSGTYDLVTAAAVSRDMSDSWTNFIDFIANEMFGHGVGYTIENNNIGESATKAALELLRDQANAFLQDAYGLPDEGRFQIGGDLPLYDTGLWSTPILESMF